MRILCLLAILALANGASISFFRSPILAPPLPAMDHGMRSYSGPFYCDPETEQCEMDHTVDCPAPTFSCDMNNGSTVTCTLFPFDGDPCSEEICDPELGCVTEVDPECCSDAYPCTAPGDLCICNGCTPACDAFHINCDDSDPCTVDSCTAGECVYTPVDCDDTNPATVDYCAGGQCYHVYVSRFATYIDHN